MIERLLEKNRAWAAAKVEDEPDFFRRLSRQQTPEYLWIGCSDSRVPANQIVGLDPGELFVHRNVANVIQATDLNCMAVVQFAIEHLKVRHIIVCGHYGCGGVRAALLGGVEGMASHWLEPVREIARGECKHLEALGEEDARIDRLCEMNVVRQVNNLAETPVLRDAWSRGQELAIHGWIYGLENGLLGDLDVTIRGPQNA